MSRRLLSGKGYSHGGGGPAYTGPGDLSGLGGAFGWWGFRAYNNAYISGAKHIVDLLAPSGLIGTLITLDCDATGYVPTGAGSPYAVWAAANTVTAGTALVTKLYDQIGTNHLTQGTAANMPTFNPSGVTSMSLNNNFAGAYIFSSPITQAQTFSVSTIANRVTNNLANCPYFENGGTGAAIAYDAQVPPHIFCGSVTTTNAVTLNHASAIQCVVKGAGSTIYLDGTATTGTSSTFAFGGDSLFVLSQTVDVVKFTEAGLWSGDVSGTSNANFAALNTNQHAAYGGF